MPTRADFNEYFIVSRLRDCDVRQHERVCVDSRCPSEHHRFHCAGHSLTLDIFPPDGIRMIVTTDFPEITVDNSPLRIFVAAPTTESKSKFPGIIFYSDIFQLTSPMLRACVRLAGYGFVVAAPEIYHRIESPGTVIAFDDAGRSRGLHNASRTKAAEFDRDCRAVLDYLAEHPFVSPAKLGAAGFCIGGHLSFRAALQPDVRATVCFYGTGIHDGKLGSDEDAGSLQAVAEVKGELLMIFGEADPHVSKEGRERIRAALQQAGVKYRVKLYPAEHAFMRDEGPRYDPECADLAFADMVHLFRSTFGESSGTAA
jgi:carboxymethylenebutenolidase